MVKISDCFVWQESVCPVCAQFYIGYDKILPISVNGSFRDLINCAYSDSFLLVIRKGICHIPEGLSDINSFPITWMLDILAAFPDGFQPFFFTFLSGIPFYDERHIVVFIAFFHKDAYVFRCIVAGIQLDEQWFFRQLSAQFNGLFQEINWSVIWMVAGGFALGLALNESGLAENVIKSIPFSSWSPVAILLASGLICYILSNFISNTATAALLVPILAVVCKGMGNSLESIGGTPTVLIGIAVAASVAMTLPISTPPNAIAHSTGLVKQNEMMKIGLTMGIIGLVLGYSLLFFLGEMHAWQ
jgi:hypothetical protein